MKWVGYPISLLFLFGLTWCPGWVSSYFFFFLKSCRLPGETPFSTKLLLPVCRHISPWCADVPCQWGWDLPLSLLLVVRAGIKETRRRFWGECPILVPPSELTALWFSLMHTGSVLSLLQPYYEAELRWFQFWIPRISIWINFCGVGKS